MSGARSSPRLEARATGSAVTPTRKSISERLRRLGRGCDRAPAHGMFAFASSVSSVARRRSRGRSPAGPQREGSREEEIREASSRLIANPLCCLWGHQPEPAALAGVRMAQAAIPAMRPVRKSPETPIPIASELSPAADMSLHWLSSDSRLRQATPIFACQFSLQHR